MQRRTRTTTELISNYIIAFVISDKEVQKIVSDMIGIIINPKSDETERDMARNTMLEALVPSEPEEKN